MLIRKIARAYEDLLTTMKRQRVKWYGHITPSSGVADTIIQKTE